MKRYLAIFGFVFIGVIAGLIVRGIPIVLQVNAGGGIPQADRNGDVNGDARLDMSDAVYLLLHIFRDGPQPVALAQGVPDNMEQLLTEISNPCRQRHDRFVENGDGTVTDTCTGLMWLKQILGSAEDQRVSASWDQAQVVCDALTFAGHEDWRLPTVRELASLFESGAGYRGGICQDAIQTSGASVWTATPNYTNSNTAWMLVTEGNPAGEQVFEELPISSHRWLLPVRTAR